MVKENLPPSQATLERVALENLGGFRGDAEVAEGLGISTTPESLQSRINSGRKVARILGQSDAVAELEPGQPATAHDNPKYGFDRESWEEQSDEQKRTNEAGIKAAREALKEARKRSKEQ